MSSSNKKAKGPSKPISQALRLPHGPVSMADLDPSATPGYPGKGKEDAPALTEALGPQVSDLQEMLYAAGRSNPETAPRVLVVLQGMDTSGKGGVIRHAMGLVDPQGIDLTAFKAPTEEERKHDYLWRIRNALPGAGKIGIFDRSHYEDVLVVRVESLVPEDVWSKRYDEINQFEAELVAGGTRIIKCMLNVSSEEQKARLAERLEDPTKYWKYNPARCGRPQEVAGLHGGVRGPAGEVQHRRSALVRDSGRPQVVPQLGGRRTAPRDAGRHAAVLACRRVRRRGGEGASRSELTRKQLKLPESRELQRV